MDPISPMAHAGSPTKAQPFHQGTTLHASDPHNAEQSFLTHLPLDKMAAISETTPSNTFSWMEILEFRFSLKFVRKGPIDNIPALV